MTPGPNTCTAPVADFASADTSRLIRTPGRRPNSRLLVKKNISAEAGLLVLGALCRMRPRLRRTEISLRRSRHVANVEGSARDRYRSPSSLSMGASMPDRPRSPASSALSSNTIIRSSSAGVGFTPSVVARSRPSTLVRRSECPSIEPTFGPSGRSSMARTYSAGSDHVFLASSAPWTNLRGTASTRLNRSAASSVSA